MAWVVVAAAGGAIVSGVIGAKGSRDAAKTQSDASDRALAVFERNAGLSQDILKESTNTAIGTIESGRERSRTNLRDTADAGISTLTSASNAANDTLRGSSTDAINTLKGSAADATSTLQARKESNRGNILQAFGLQKDAINGAAIASSGIINAAREKATNAIMSGFGDAANSVKSGRDLVNSILQSSTADANQKLDIARAGAIAAQDRGLQTIRSDYQPYVDAGKIALADVQKLIADPQAQKDFIANNPFFDSLAKNAEDRLLSNQAARGRVGTGSTQKELHNELLMLGNNLLDTTINQRMGLVNTGMSATGSVAGAETNRANTVSGIEQQTGKSLADLAAQLGVNMGNNETGAAKTIAELGVNRGKDLAATETNAATQLANIEQNKGTGISNAVSSGISLLTNSQTGLDRDIANTQNNLGVNTANAQTALGTNVANNQTALGNEVANIQTQTGTNISNLNTAASDATAKLESNLGVNQANILTGQAANTADTLIGQGDAKAAGIIGQANAVQGTISQLGTIASEALETPAEKALRLDRERVAAEQAERLRRTG